MSRIKIKRNFHKSPTIVESRNYFAYHLSLDA